MASVEVDRDRRQFLTQATTVVGAVGVVAVAVPFADSMSISARARAVGAPVEADIGKLAPGQKVVHEWRGRPVWIIHRTPRMLESLTGIRPRLADPDSNASEQPSYATNRFRAREDRPEILVFIAICTHLGCVPSYRPEAGPADLGSDWPGGFFCPCHGSRYDLAARVFRGQPAPRNMAVPPYLYVNDTRIVIGEDEAGG